jgi:hypothetical protein
VRSLGPEYIAAWDLAEELNPESEDGKALNAAFDSLTAWRTSVLSCRPR